MIPPELPVHDADGLELNDFDTFSCTSCGAFYEPGEIDRGLCDVCADFEDEVAL